ncbi:hypothetical protein HDU91_006599, partial [Kappamyces sp. JEL0680]
MKQWQNHPSKPWVKGSDQSSHGGWDCSRCAKQVLAKDCYCVCLETMVDSLFDSVGLVFVALVERGAQGRLPLPTPDVSISPWQEVEPLAQKWCRMVSYQTSVKSLCMPRILTVVGSHKDRVLEQQTLRKCNDVCWFEATVQDKAAADM